MDRRALRIEEMIVSTRTWVDVTHTDFLLLAELPGFQIHWNAQPDFIPMAARILANGQKPVKADCSRLKPTNAGTASQ